MPHQKKQRICWDQEQMYFNSVKLENTNKDCPIVLKRPCVLCGYSFLCVPCVPCVACISFVPCVHYVPCVPSVPCGSCVPFVPCVACIPCVPCGPGVPCVRCVSLCPLWILCPLWLLSHLRSRWPMCLVRHCYAYVAGGGKVTPDFKWQIWSEEYFSILGFFG